jgi:hypothetical protein
MVPDFLTEGRIKQSELIRNGSSINEALVCKEFSRLAGQLLQESRGNKEERISVEVALAFPWNKSKPKTKAKMWSKVDPEFIKNRRVSKPFWPLIGAWHVEN